MTTPPQIIGDVAHAMGLQHKTVVGPSKTLMPVRARFMAAWLMRYVLHMSFADIASSLCRLDHATAMNAVKQAKQLRSDNAEFLALSDKLKKYYQK